MAAPILFDVCEKSLHFEHRLAEVKIIVQRQEGKGNFICTIFSDKKK